MVQPPVRRVPRQPRRAPDLRGAPARRGAGVRARLRPPPMPARAPKVAPELSRQAAGAPDAPGVYLWKAADGTVLYVGKAKSLRKRVRQYTALADERASVPLLMAEAAQLDWLVTDSEVESLILEANLIKEHRPRYNVDYRDDKTYPFIAVTLADPFPAIKYTREKHRGGVRYFGPYTDAKAARETIDTVRRIHPICRATCAEWKRVNARSGAPVGRPCFDRHVGKGPGPCVGAITREEYAETVAKVLAFLEGRQQRALDDIEREMYASSAELDYERAARLRTSLDAVRKVLERQRIVSESPIDADVVGVWREETVAGVQVLVVRGGRVVLGNEIVLDKGLDVPLEELVEGFLVRYYSEASHVPREVLLPALPCDPEPVEEWLAGLRGAKVALRVPERGEKRRLLEMAETNARHTLARFIHRTRYDEQRTNEALAQLESALALPAPPLRIECFDISTLHGRHSVGSMVVFTGGRADPAAYRRFRVQLATPQADAAARRPGA
ncbi:MAG: excinuclease ABC subunit UvrC, partial [Actinobacteria bacterium]